MDSQQLLNKHQQSIHNLSRLNQINNQLLIEKWKKMLSRFHYLTLESDLAEEFEQIPANNDIAFAAFTQNGSIIISSRPDVSGVRMIHYMSLDIRQDRTRFIPRIFTSKLVKDLKIGRPAFFETIQTSPVIAMRGKVDWADQDFREKANSLCVQFNQEIEQEDI